MNEMFDFVQSLSFIQVSCEIVALIAWGCLLAWNDRRLEIEHGVLLKKHYAYCEKREQFFKENVGHPEEANYYAYLKWFDKTHCN